MLKRILFNNPLIQAGSSILSEEMLKGNLSESTIYYGTGLVTTKQTSVALPFDVLTLFLTAEKIRRCLGMKQVIQLIADTHAKTNAFTKPEEIDRMANEVKVVMNNLAELNGLSSFFSPILASELDKLSIYQEVYNSIEIEEHQYVRRELADIECLRRIYSLKIKLSWTIGSRTVRLDERFFDSKYSEAVGQEMCFIYTMPGRTLNKERPKVSPYISISGESRIIFRKGENVRAKFEEGKKEFGKKFKKLEEYFEAIIKLYEELFGSVYGNDVPEKIQNIIDQVCA